MKLGMLGSAPVVIALLASVTLSIVWAATLPVNDPYVTANQQWNGASELAKMGFTPVMSDLGDALLPTRGLGVLMIIAPSRPFSGADANAIKDFVQAGGLLVIADNSILGNHLLELLQVPIRFDGRLLVDTLFYQSQPFFPVIFDLQPSDLCAGVHELVLDYATALNITTNDTVRILANSTRFSFLEADGGGKAPEEGSGSFPVLAEVAMGKGTVAVFSSPASFLNGVIGEFDNRILVENILSYASSLPAGGIALLDETHSEVSLFTTVEQAANSLVAAAMNGGMGGSAQLALASLVMVVVACRYAYRKPAPLDQKAKGSTGEIFRSTDVESALSRHPSWSRRKLEYVKSELESSMRWRRLLEAE